MHSSFPFAEAIFPSAFNTNCVIGVSVAGGSCTAASNYWSSTTVANDPGIAWLVDFIAGRVFPNDKGNTFHVRAVRGGS